MNNPCIRLAVTESYAVPACAQTAGAAPLEALGRALGYTERELALAGEVLNRFMWRPTALSRRVRAAEREKTDSGPDRKRVA